MLGLNRQAPATIVDAIVSYIRAATSPAVTRNPPRKYLAMVELACAWMWLT